MNVIVIGGGIGGLCLAQGLRAAGVDVTVFERDAAPDSRREGFRLHVDPVGARSLRACLPPPLWEAFLATAGRAGDFGFLTEGLDELVVVEESIMYPGRTRDPAEDHYAADRATLRRLLLAGLDVRFSAEFVRYEHADDGRVVAVFADGRRVVGDLLVGADGTGSRVRRQYLPHAGLEDAGFYGIGHKIYLTDETRRWVPRRLQTGMNAVLVDAPVALFTSVYEPPRCSRAALERVGVMPPPGVDVPYLLCALLARADAVPDLTALDGPALAGAVDACIAGWHPDLRRLLAESDEESRHALRFGASRAVAPWESTNVTVLGDAIHTMPPLGGHGGNTAMRDAGLLTRVLASVQRGERGLRDAVAEYEAELRTYGGEAVRAALAGRRELLSGGLIGTLAARSWFRLCRVVPALRRRTFGGFAATSRPRPWELDRAA
jgi:2-polyprenyl-6-methoxyphenol hydroxylase-like FAD-dependent oxidoreductase